MPARRRQVRPVDLAGKPQRRHVTCHRALIKGRAILERIMAQNRVFDDFTRLMSDATEVAQGVRREAETAMKSQLDRLLATMDVVTREEFEAVKQMAAKAREENEKLSQRLTAFEAELAKKTKAARE
jgi:BMFP domain-containing protein YqiC